MFANSTSQLLDVFSSKANLNLVLEFLDTDLELVIQEIEGLSNKNSSDDITSSSLRLISVRNTILVFDVIFNMSFSPSVAVYIPF